MGPGTWEVWCRERDRLLRTHPQTPVADPDGFEGVPYFPYDPAFAVEGHVTPVAGDPMVVGHSGEGGTAFREVGRVDFVLAGRPQSLPLYWLDAYGGGVFLPFRDATSGTRTYGGGRYLLDGAKAADLGGWGRMLVLDFNFAYHPSCVHSARWSCPLAPPGNAVDVAVTAGERLAGQRVAPR